MLSVDEIIETGYDVLKNIFPVSSKENLKDFINNLGFKKAICVPFYDKNNNQEIYLPIEIIFIGTGSNGMCAGNTPEEALIQGLCEILERYSSREIYTKRIVPPTIPNEYFSDYSVYSLIGKIENDGYSIIIKDFSFGKGLPVIAVIVVDKKNNKYNVKVGSDPWPVIALERCLTELHQSFSGICLIDWKGFGDFIDDKYKTLERSEAEFITLRDVFSNASGQWPDFIFSDNFDYKFEGLNFSLGQSNKSDLKFLTNLIERLGFSIYVRDVSYLGLNAYYIVVPKMSLQKTKKEDYFYLNNLNLELAKLANISLLSEEEIESLVEIMEEKYHILKSDHIKYRDKFVYSADKDAFNYLYLDLFLCMANYRLNNIEKANYYLTKFLKDKNRKSYIYFYACKDYLALKQSKKDDNEILSLLSKVYEKNLAVEAVEDMKDRKNIFKSYNLQSYFTSNSCNIDKFDYYPVAKILKKIEEKQRLNPINQLALNDVL